MVLSQFNTPHAAAARRLPPRPRGGGCGGPHLTEVAAGGCRRRLDRRPASRRRSAAAGAAAAAQNRPDMAGQAADWLRLTGAWGSLERGLRSASWPRSEPPCFSHRRRSSSSTHRCPRCSGKSKCPPWPCPSSALVPPRGAPGGSGWLDTLPGSSPAIGRPSQAP